MTERDLRRVLDVVDSAGGLDPDAGAGVPAPLLQALAALVPTDLVSFLDFDPERTTSYVVQEWDGERSVVDDRTLTDPDDPFWQQYDDSLACSYPTRSGDHRSITLRSDFYTTAQWRRTAIYGECFKEDRLDYELMCCLPPVHSRSSRFVFFRSTRDFDERDRLMMALLRPHLVEMCVQRQPTTPPLTTRQTELMRLVAAGWTNAEIATSLFVSPHTVRKHLENIFARLGVTSRTAAVARAFST
ncbi:MAG: ATP-dependent transcriptional regulator, MalT-like, LuxR family [Frankiales bacterium]|nr:ATP-dependent transcriptional regulator, MalT-like, LuxR family [Frankiales bacterium]